MRACTGAGGMVENALQGFAARDDDLAHGVALHAARPRLVGLDQGVRGVDHGLKLLLMNQVEE